MMPMASATFAKFGFFKSVCQSGRPATSISNFTIPRTLLLNTRTLIGKSYVHVHVQLAQRLSMFPQHRIEEGPVRFGFEHRQQRPDRFPRVSTEAEVELAAAPELLDPDVDLDDLRLGRKGVVVGEIRAEEKENVALVHRFVGGAKSQKAVHSDLERIVVRHGRLAPVGITDGCLQLVGEGHDLVVGLGTAESAEAINAQCACWCVTSCARIPSVARRRRWSHRRGMSTG